MPGRVNAQERSEKPAPSLQQKEKSVPDRVERLNTLFAELADAKTAKLAHAVAEEIEALWHESGSATENLLLSRALEADKRGDKALAQRLFEHSLTLFPDHAEAWARSAYLSYEEKNFKQALERVNRAISLEPRHFRAYYLLGLILESLDKKEGAYKAYQTALRLYPHDETTQKHLKVLEKDLQGRAL